MNTLRILIALALSAPVVLFAQTGSATVQVLHNSPDPVVSTVDVLVAAVQLDGDTVATGIAFNNLGYLEANPSTSVSWPALPGELVTDSLDILVLYYVDTTVLQGALNLGDPLPAATPNVVNAATLMDGGSYIAIAQGMVVDSGYTGLQTGSAFSTKVIAMAQFTGVASDTVTAAVYHGSPDAPGVDVDAVDVNNVVGDFGSTIVAGATFGVNTGYLNLPLTDYIVNILAAGTGTSAGGRWSLPASTLGLGNTANLVFAHGFINSANQTQAGGNAFGISALLADGTVAALTPVTFSTIVHNSPDEAAAAVDLYYTAPGSPAILFIDSLEFRSAEITFVPTVGQLDVVPHGDPIGSSVYTIPDLSILDNRDQYWLVAQGIRVPNNPRYTGAGFTNDFEISAVDGFTTGTADVTTVNVTVSHGTPDADGVDLDATLNGSTINLATNLPYLGTTTFDVGIDEAFVEILPTGVDDPLVVLRLDPTILTVLLGINPLVVASGFIDPAYTDTVAGDTVPRNLFGGFSVIPANPLAPKGFIQIETVDSVPSGIAEDLTAVSFFEAFPNPAAGTLNLAFRLEESADVNVRISDINGREIQRNAIGRLNTGAQIVQMDVNALPAGLYFYTVEVNGQVSIERFIKQ